LHRVERRITIDGMSELSPNAALTLFKRLEQQLAEAGFRAEIDKRSERLGKKIAEAEVHKAPYMLLMGRRDVEGGVVSMRKRGEGDLGAMTMEAVIEKLKSEL